MSVQNGLLRRWQMIAAICVTLAAGLSVGTAYAWPFLTAIVHHTQTIMWVTQLRYNYPDLGPNHGKLIDRLNGAAKRDAEMDELRNTIIEVKLGLGALAQQQAELKGMLVHQETMLQALIQNTSPRPRP